MIDRTTKLRWRRRFRRSRRHVEDMGVQAEQQLERHLFRRLTRLFEVRRFIISWVLLLILLGGGVTMQLLALGAHYQELQAAPGGTYSEGMVGSFTNANPLYATGLVDTTVSRLIFAGLLKYNDKNQLVGDLAENWKADADGKVYTVKLRPNLKWHDGHDLTVDDVLFTFQTIQNPDAQSPLFRAWQGVTMKETAPRTITFTLSSPLAPFAYSLTTGIIPKHLLGSVQASQLRSSTFNTAQPIGSGPFSWQTIEIVPNGNKTNRQHIGLKPFADYYPHAPLLERFIVKTYADEEQLINGFQKQEVTGILGLDRLPDSLANQSDIQQHTAPLAAETAVFLRTDSDILKDVHVRQALVEAVNVPSIVAGMDYPAIVADEPLLKGQLGYNPALKELPLNVEAAKQALDAAGWKLAPGQAIRTNGTTKLSLKFFAQNNADYAYITQQVQKAWLAIGVDAEVTLLDDTDLQDIINARAYDALLYGVSIGADPDVFAYWHSTQADKLASSRLNFSDYKSSVADKALEAGRSRFDPALRAAKYVPFLQAWQSDAPAITLYQPRFFYVTRGPLFGFEPKALNTAADRFNNVQEWAIRQDYQIKE